MGKYLFKVPRDNARTSFFNNVIVSSELQTLKFLWLLVSLTFLSAVVNETRALGTSLGISSGEIPKLVPSPHHSPLQRFAGKLSARVTEDIFYLNISKKLINF